MARSRAKEETRSGEAAVTEEQAVETAATTANLSPYGWVRPREFQGPVRLQTLRAIPTAEGEPIPDGTEFVAGPRVAKAVWDPGLAGLIHEYGPSEDAPATDRPEDVEIQLRLLELQRQWVADRNESARRFQARDLESLEEHLTQLKAFIGDFLSKQTNGTVSPADPDFENRLQKWWEQLAEGEIPEEFDRQVFERDQGKAWGLIHYARVVSSLRSQSQGGLRWALPAAQVIAGRQEAQLRILMLEAEGKLAEAADYQRQLDEQTLEAADVSDLGASELLNALRIALSLLASMDPEHLILGARTQDRLRKIAQKDYRAAAVELFRRIMEHEGVHELEEIWQWAGTNYYRTVEVNGARFTFKKDETALVIFGVDEDGDKPVRRQEFKASTLYGWRADALKALSSGS